MNTKLIGLVAVLVVMSWTALGQPRVVRGQVIDRRSDEWTIFREQAEVVGASGRNLILRTFTEKEVVSPMGGSGNLRAWPVYNRVKRYHETFMLTNFPAPGRFKAGDVIRTPIVALRVGTAMVDSGERSVYTSNSGYRSEYSSSARQLDLYDCGVEYVPPVQPLTPQQAQAAKAAAEKKSEAAAEAIFKFHQDRADAGNVGSMVRLGQLYLQGKGTSCDTNQAKMWFEKAAAQGNEEAAGELRRLNRNSP